MKTIPLTQGFEAIVDDEDYELVAGYKWRVKRAAGGLFYAHTSCLTDDGEMRYHLLHRFLMRPGRGQFVDHRDWNGLNNCRSNLRLVTPAENSRWRRKSGAGTYSQYKGVTFDKSSGRWIARIYKEGKRSSYYTRSEVDAAKQYNEWARQLFGEFAYLNPV